MNSLKRFPLHPFFLALYPVIALLAENIQEIDPQIGVRPVLIGLAGTFLLYFIVYLGMRDWLRAALLTSLLLILFSSYGHLYEIFKNTTLFDISLGRHRILVPVYGAFLALGLWWGIKTKKIQESTQFINVVSIALIIFPTLQITSYYVQVASGERAVIESASNANSLSVNQTGPPPDIYYIILDAYTRGDALERDYNFDNSPFLNELESIGFSVADCSRSNYAHTNPSLASALNMDYDVHFVELAGRIKYSLVREQLESLGYKTVAFDTGYGSSNITNAEIYLALNQNPLVVQSIAPFEAMLVRSTAALIYTDWLIKAQLQRIEPIDDQLNSVNFPFQATVERQKFILEQLPHVTAIPGPKFVFAHIVVTHFPFLFKPDGEIQEDPGYFGGTLGRALDVEHEEKGYLDSIQFINPRLIEIVKSILKNSSTPPIIIIQGDHGLKLNNRNQILNAYYLPGEDSSGVYDHITPVNSFRVVFNSYFDTDYDLLPDISYERSDNGTVIPETSPDCIQR